MARGANAPAFGATPGRSRAPPGGVKPSRGLASAHPPGGRRRDFTAVTRTKMKMKQGLNVPKKAPWTLSPWARWCTAWIRESSRSGKRRSCDIHVSGGEFNVAANLSDCFGLRTGIATAMVDYPIGDLIAERVRAMGVKGFYRRFKHDGVHGPNMATVYSDRGQGVRAPVVFYNRCNEAAAQLKPGDFNWKEIFAGGVRWFHSGGIFAALSPNRRPS